LSLTTEQIDFFKANGYLVAKNLINPGVVEEWRKQMWAHIGSSLETPDTWPGEYVVQGFEYEPPESAFGQLPAVQSIVEQVGGGAFTGGGGSPLVQWPKPPDTEWSLPSSGHIDAYGPGGWSPFMLGATTYLYDVEPGGGAFVYWPKSHLTTHEYFLEYPEQIDGSFREVEGWGWNIFSDRSPEGAHEFTAHAGDVVFWHCFLCHTGSSNVRSIPRFGIFARWRHEQREDIKYEIPEDLWKYWAI
jgi:hypothetical protein